jgi:D-arabinose 1-dehydrogenase-like Zn-dependent alcohol dehydrogenase
LPNPKPAVIPGHDVVGIVEELGEAVDRFAIRGAAVLVASS